MKKVLLIATAVIFLAAGNAHAIVPTIDGLVTSLTEWSGSQLSGGDANEGDISDSWDIKSIFMKVIAGDGWYFRMDTYGKPTYAGGPGSGFSQSFFDFYLDYHGDGTLDYLVDLNGQNYPKQQKVSVYDNLGNEIGTAGTSGTLSDIVEMYVPDSLLSTSIFTSNSSHFGIYARLDNAGDEPDDKLPNSGYLKTPEPGSTALLGMGLIGLVGRLFRRKVKA